MLFQNLEKFAPHFSWCCWASKNVNHTFVWFFTTSSSISQIFLDELQTLKKSRIHCMLHFSLKNNKCYLASSFSTSKNMDGFQLHSLWTPKVSSVCFLMSFSLQKQHQYRSSKLENSNWIRPRYLIHFNH